MPRREPALDPPRSRLAEKSQASIGALLDVARDSFGRQGYAKVSLEGVAAEAHMTKGAVYHHFGSKEALFEAVFRREHRRMIALVAAKSRPAADPLDSILRGSRAYLQAIVDPAVRRILLQDGPAVLGWERWRQCEEPGFQQLLETSLGAAAAKGMLRTGLRPAETAVLLLGAMTEGALTIAHSPSPRAAARRISQELAAHLGALRR
jgi:AcrR family transcriptional regulator